MKAEHETRPAAEWRASYARHIDNVRVALDWAFSPEGDVALGIDLTIAAVSLWVQLSLMGECRTRVERALELVESLGLEADVKRCRMHLTAALGWCLMYGSARTADIGKIWADTLALADELGDDGYRLRVERDGKRVRRPARG